MQKMRVRNHQVVLNRSVGGDAGIFLFLFIMGVFMFFPMVYVVMQSLKPLDELWVFPPRFYVVHPTLKNFSDLFTLPVTEVDVSNPDNRNMFSHALGRCGFKSGGVPVIVYGDKCKQGYSGVLMDEMRELLNASLNEEEKTLVASNRKAMEEDVDAFKARNADRKKAVLQFSAKTVAKTPAKAQ